MSRNSSEKKNSRRRAWQFFRPVVVTLLSVLIVVTFVFLAVRYVLSHFVYPVDEEDNTPIEVVIPKGASASSIASILYHARGEEEKGLIVNTASFKIYVDFVGKANNLQAGTYILSRNMSIPEIVNILCEGNTTATEIRVTVPEGYTVEAIAALLVQQNVFSDPSEFLSLCATGAGFEEYTFLPGAVAGVHYRLEGYLFPDTYEFARNSSGQAVIEKMLSRYREMFTPAYRTRAEELDLTENEVIVLASIIEKEAAEPDDFARVSAVFHNRLKTGMSLESCATLSYALGVQKLTFSTEEIVTDSPFNTYHIKGLPMGAICNPGVRAIEAALYPNEAYLSEGYLFFCNADPSLTRALLFSKTYEEHQQKVQTYSKFWN